MSRVVPGSAIMNPVDAADAVVFYSPTGVPLGSSTNPLPVAIAPAGGAGTGTTSQVASSASAVTILAANTSRKGATIVNDSTSILYLILSSTTPTSGVYTIALDAKGTVGSYYELPYGYTGIVKGIWASANGNAVVTEFA